MQQRSWACQPVTGTQNRPDPLSSIHHRHSRYQNVLLPYVWDCCLQITSPFPNTLDFVLVVSFNNRSWHTQPGRSKEFCPVFLLAMKPRRACWEELIGMFTMHTQWVWGRDQLSSLPSAWDSAGHSFTCSSPQRQSLKSVSLHTAIPSPPQTKEK